MLALERRNRILEKLQEDKKVVVSELSRLFDVSEETIRRDLDKLDKEGLAIKSYGGAVINENTSIDMPFNVRKKKNVQGKMKIAELLLSLVENGEHILLDASTTSVFAAKALKEKERLTVITNSIEILIELSDVSDWNVISSGGTIREGYLALVGPKAVESLGSYNVEKAILSCKGFHREKGITEGFEELSQAKKVMIDAAKEVILLVDSSKFDVVSFSKVCMVEQVDTVITDQEPDSSWMEYFKNHNICCIYPDK